MDYNGMNQGTNKSKRNLAGPQSGLPTVNKPSMGPVWSNAPPCNLSINARLKRIQDDKLKSCVDKLPKSELELLDCIKCQLKSLDVKLRQKLLEIRLVHPDKKDYELVELDQDLRCLDVKYFNKKFDYLQVLGCLPPGVSDGHSLRVCHYMKGHMMNARNQCEKNLKRCLNMYVGHAKKVKGNTPPSPLPFPTVYNETANVSTNTDAITPNLRIEKEKKMVNKGVDCRLIVSNKSNDKKIDAGTFYKKDAGNIRVDNDFLVRNEKEKNAFLNNPPNSFLANELNNGLLQKYLDLIEASRGFKVSIITEQKVKEAFGLIVEGAAVESIAHLVNFKRLFKDPTYNNCDKFMLRQLIQQLHRLAVRKMSRRRPRGRDLQPVAKGPEGAKAEIGKGMSNDGSFGWDDVVEGDDLGGVDDAGLEGGHDDGIDIVAMPVVTVGVAIAKITLAPTTFPLLACKIKSIDVLYGPVNVSKGNKVSKYIFYEIKGLQQFFQLFGVQSTILTGSRRGVVYEAQVDEQSPAVLQYSVKKMVLSLTVPYSRHST